MGQSTAGSIPDDATLPFPDDTCSGDESNAENQPRPNAALEKVACDRCRRRKIKCDRIHPCTQCIRAESPCSYPIVHKREMRQRVLISSMYESRIEHIAQKIDNLTRLMEGLKGINSNSEDPARPSDYRKEKYFVENGELSRLAVAEHQGTDTSLISHAISATKFLEEAIRNGGNEQATVIGLEMESALETLQAVVGSQGQRNRPEEDGPPFRTILPPGKTTRDLPVPPIVKVMACLRMAQAVPTSWLSELKPLGDFTLYVVKVCSPGPATDAELIIAYMGLYWLFDECAMMASTEARDDLHRQAEICQSSLEAVLSTLGFYIPSTIDYVLAMYLATVYCLQKGKVFACWTFISKASLLAQALGLHTASTAAYPLEDRHRVARLFWSVYSLERGVSLRLARPSTIRDQSITIPRPGPQPIAGVITGYSLADVVNAARIYGLIYDEIYSPKALAQTKQTRTACVHALAAEWRESMANRAQHVKTLAKRFEGSHEPAMIDFAGHAAAVGDYLVLTAIYRAAPGRTPSTITTECTSAARAALREHTKCISMLLDNELQSAQVEFWVNSALILHPFIAFNIVFCNVVDTGDLGDLENLRALVQAMGLLSETTEYASCTRQLQIFQALYTVAARYVEVMGRANLAAESSGGLDSGTAEGVAIPCSQMPSSGTHMGSGTAMDDFVHSGVFTEGSDFQPLHGVPGSHAWAGLGGMEFDPLGTQLSSWFQGSNEAMDFLGG